MRNGDDDMEERYLKLKSVLEDIELNGQEEKTLHWLSEWETETVDNMVSIMRKLTSSLKGTVAKLTGTAIQDDETFKSEGCFVPERDQYYFQMQQGDNVFLVGFKDLLICLRLLEKMNETPAIGDKWWQQMATLYGQDILMIDFKETT